MLTNGLRIIAVASAALALAHWTLHLHGKAGPSQSWPLTLVLADPHHADTLLAGTATAHLFRSRDAGDTWSLLPFPGSSLSSLHAMLIDPAQPNVYLVAVSSEKPQYAGVFRTADEGVTWSQLPGLEKKQVWALTFWKADSRVIAAGAQDGVFLSRDGGENWAGLSSGSAFPQPVVSLAFDPEDGRILYAGTPHLAWKTTDGGGAWQRIHRGMQADSDIFSIDIDVRQRSRLFAGACSGIYSSRDGGGTWFSLERALGGQLRTYVVTRTPLRPNVVFAGTSSGLIQSPDGGATWRKLSLQPARSIAFDPADPQRIFVATDQGILRSEDGGTRWRLQPILSTPIADIAVPITGRLP